MTPTLLNSCAWATTAREAAYRIDKPPAYVRTSRVFGLDGGALRLLDVVSRMPWHDTRFLPFDPATLDDDLRSADFAMMIATNDDGAAAASAIGHACASRGITTAGIVLGTASEAVTALRPHARVLLVTEDRQDIVEILSEVGA